MIEFEQVGKLDFKDDKELNKCYVFLCKKWKNEPTESEEMKPHWFDIEKIPYEKMWSADKYWMPHILSGKKISAVFRYDAENNLIGHDVRVLGDGYEFSR